MAKSNFKDLFSNNESIIGFDEETFYPENSEPPIIKPFDPKEVDIVAKTMVISNIIEQLRDGEIILNPEYQRKANLWNEKDQSRLIESIIIRIPLPSFYFDTTDDEKLIVVDGLQRLTAIRRFAVLEPNNKDKLRLKDLEYINEYNGYTFEELPVNIQRRIRQTEIIAYVIRKGTPDNVRNSIFTRINTAGLRLEPAEIRNAVYRGVASTLLKELAESPAFKEATKNRIKCDRMEDRELINRFLAFYILGTEKYNGNLESYLNQVLSEIKAFDANQINDVKKAFTKSMEVAVQLFGDKAFRRLNSNGKYGKINKPLFECVSVSLAELAEERCSFLVRRKEDFILHYEALFFNKEFTQIISNATAKLENVKRRFAIFKEILDEVIGNATLP